MIRIHYLSFLFLVFLSDTVSAKEIHFIYFRDQGSVSEQCTKTIKGLLRLFGNTVPTDQMLVHEMDIAALANNDAFRQEIGNVAFRDGIGNDDALVFVYSGHGLASQDSKRYMTPKQGSFVQRQEALATVRGCGAGFTLFITDMCSNYGSVPVQAMGGCADCGATLFEINQIHPTVDRLFFKTRGLVEISSSRLGQKAFAPTNEMTLFGTHFVASIQGVLSSQRATWTSVCSFTSNQVASDSKSRIKRWRNSGMTILQDQQTVDFTDSSAPLNGEVVAGTPGFVPGAVPEQIDANEVYVDPASGELTYLTIRRKIDHTQGTEFVTSVTDQGRSRANRPTENDPWEIPTSYNGRDFQIRLRAHLGINPVPCSKQANAVHVGKIIPGSAATRMLNEATGDTVSLREDDHILSVNGTPVADPNSTIALILGSPDGVTLEISRDNARRTFSTNLAFGRGWR